MIWNCFFFGSHYVQNDSEHVKSKDVRKHSKIRIKIYINIYYIYVI